jgi:hypothetical protein
MIIFIVIFSVLLNVNVMDTKLNTKLSLDESNTLLMKVYVPVGSQDTMLIDDYNGRKP